MIRRRRRPSIVFVFNALVASSRTPFRLQALLTGFAEKPRAGLFIHFNYQVLFSVIMFSKVVLFSYLALFSLGFANAFPSGEHDAIVRRQAATSSALAVPPTVTTTMSIQT
ncbi:hypothetical protein BDR07DRAFT_64635 [Suillus spraguei]|nr:hypothetical protein BDR07DRAFT_64635 [Suillus spraguei]